MTLNSETKTPQWQRGNLPSDVHVNGGNSAARDNGRANIHTNRGGCVPIRTPEYVEGPGAAQSAIDRDSIK
jgi:hypothetical protein